MAELTGNVVVPIALIVSLLLAAIGWVRQSSASNAIVAIAQGQLRCQSCLNILATESTKQTVLLEQIANNAGRRS